MKNKGWTIKKKLITLSLLAGLFGLTGCDLNVPISTGTLDTYFEVEDQTAGVITSFNTFTRNHIEVINRFRDCYSIFGDDLRLNGLTVDQVAQKLEERISKFDDTETLLVDNDGVTGEGNEIINAMWLRDDYSYIMREMAFGCAEAVRLFLYEGNDTGTKGICTYSTYLNNDKPNSNDLAKIAGLYGFAPTSIKIKIGTFNSTDSTFSWIGTSNDILDNHDKTKAALEKRLQSNSATLDTKLNINHSFSMSIDTSGIFYKKTASGSTGLSSGGMFPSSKYTIYPSLYNGLESSIASTSSIGNQQIVTNICADKTSEVFDYYDSLDFYHWNWIVDSHIEDEDDFLTADDITYVLPIGTMHGATYDTTNHDIDITFHSVKTIYVYVTLTNLKNASGNKFEPLYSKVGSTEPATGYTATGDATITLKSILTDVKNIMQNIEIYVPDYNRLQGSTDLKTLEDVGNSLGGVNATLLPTWFSSTGKKGDLLSTNFDETKDYTKKSALYIGSLEVGHIKYEALDASSALTVLGNVIADSDHNAHTSFSKSVPIFKIMKKSSTSTAISNYAIAAMIQRIGYADSLIAEDPKPDGSHEYYIKFLESNMFANLYTGDIFAFGSRLDTPTTFQFKPNDSMVLYTSSDIKIDKHSGWANSERSNLVSNSNFIQDVCSAWVDRTNPLDVDAINKLNSIFDDKYSPFLLDTYLEAVYCPQIYPANETPDRTELFLATGRKIILDNAWFSTVPVQENSVAFIITYPDENRTVVGGLTGKVTHLFSSEIVTNATGDSQGLGKIVSVGNTDYIIAPFSRGTKFNQCNIIYRNVIKFGEFKTANDGIGSNTPNTRSDESLLAKYEDAANKANHTVVPSLFVINSTFINNTLASYLGSNQFTAWRTWLDNNGYPNYLAETEGKDLADSIVVQLENIYDITLNGELGMETLVINTGDLKEVENFLQEKNMEKFMSILIVVMRVLGIVIMAYAVLILLAYQLDVNVAGEGEGILKRVTFNRMKSCPGISKEERTAMTEKSEKGTYTIHAVALVDLIPICLVLFIVAVLLLVGAMPMITNQIIKYAEQVTKIVKDAITSK